MSNDHANLMRQLEQATAAEARSDADASLDAETAELRETWQALGRLLEAAEPPEPLELPAVPRQPARLQLGMVVAVAASLLVVATLAWTLVRNGGPWNNVPGSGSTEEIAEKPAVDVPEVAPTPEPGPEVEDEALLAWDDSLDERIALAGQQVVRVQQDWYGLDDAYSPVLEGLQQISEEIEDETL